MSFKRSSLDRRTAHRVSCGLEVEEIAGDQLLPCQVLNLSEAGIYLRRLSGGLLLEGERIHLQLRLPGSPEVIWAVGQVVESVEETLHDAAAVELVVLAEADRLRLRRFVQGIRRERLRFAVAGLDGAQVGGNALRLHSPLG